jgi:5'-nucleotidase
MSSPLARSTTDAPLPDGHEIDPTTRREVQRPRQIFVNRNLRLDKIELIGFDMDYTLAVYHKRRSEELAYELTLARLISERGYPADIGSIRYDPSFVVRGLVIDKERGNILKADRYSYVGRCYHGRRLLTSEQRQALYRSEKVRLGTDRYAWMDTLFALPEACLYAYIIDLLESSGRTVDYRKLYEDIRAMIDSVHRDGSLKTELKKEIDHYIVKDPELGPALHKLRSAGKKLFLATNSHWDYTDAVMTHLLEGVLPEYPQWERYFDYVVVGASKPLFFSESHPFLELDAGGAAIGETRSIERGKRYQGGNLTDFETSVGITGERVLYVGDHIYGDILHSRKHSLWRTCLVVEELEDEIAHGLRRADDVRALHDGEAERGRLDDELNHLKLVASGLERRLEKRDLTPADRASLDERFRTTKVELERVRRALKQLAQEVVAREEALESSFNPYWGFVFKEGAENSRFGEQVENYACLYTSRVSNFLFYSPMQYFRSPRELMPHER